MLPVPYFYPRSPCGERPAGSLAEVAKYATISIHALLAESDHNAHMSGTLRPAFLSTLSLRRATGYTAEYIERCEHFYPRSPCGERQFYVVTIFLMFQFLSTLSLRRATTGKTGSRVLTKYFYPRSPCGERQLTRKNTSTKSHFYPRSPCGERPPLADGAQPDAAISIHALLAESDKTEAITVIAI